MMLMSLHKLHCHLLAARTASKQVNGKGEGKLKWEHFMVLLYIRNKVGKLDSEGTLTVCWLRLSLSQAFHHSV